MSQERFQILAGACLAAVAALLCAVLFLTRGEMQAPGKVRIVRTLILLTILLLGSLFAISVRWFRSYSGEMRRTGERQKDIYERELERQKIMLQMLQLQIRPHFYISCLNLIHQAADEADRGEIVELTEKLSDCMRAVLSLGDRMSTVGEELRLIRSYADIQILRYGQGNLFVDIQADEELSDKEMPPFILFHFFENAVMHATAPGRRTEVSVYVTSELIDGEKRIYATISDTGPGFPEEVLLAAPGGEPARKEEGNHIGISNSVQRLQLLYGERAGIRLSNMADGYGAVVEVMIPYEEDIQEKEAR